MLHGGGVLLKLIAVISLGDVVEPQPLAHIERVSHRHDPGRVSLPQLREKVDDTAQLLHVVGDLIVANFQASEVSMSPYVPM